MARGVTGQATGLVMKERAHWAMHSKQTQHWQSWIWEVNKTTRKHSERANTQWHVEWLAANEIGDEGARALGDALKTNTTLTELHLRCVQQGARK